MNGIVKWFSKDKGFGFINCPEQDMDVFVHISAVEGNTVLLDGQHVEFETQAGIQGRIKAKNVRVTPRE